MDAKRRRKILERLNAYDVGPTEEDRRAEREARIRQAVQTELAQAREGRSAGGLWGFFGRSVESR